MKNTNKKTFFKSPVALMLVIVLMIAVMVAIVALSSNKEAEMRAERAPEETPDARPTVVPQEEAVSTPSIDEFIVTEDGNAPMSLRSDGSYRNDDEIGVPTGYGRTLYLGLNLAAADDALYINPHFVYEYAGDPNEHYGFILRTERVPLEYSDTVPEPPSAAKNAGITDLAILGRTFDQVVPASYIDTNRFGVRWVDSPAYGGQEHAGDSLTVLVVRISDGTLVGSAHADIVYDESLGTYGFGSVLSGDVIETGDIDQDIRGDLLRRTVDYLVNGNENMSFGVRKEELEQQFEFAVVERLSSFYYNRLYDKNGNVIPAGRFVNCDLYAVHINYFGYGYFTVYYAPEPMANGLNVPILEGEDLKLVIIGYDAVAPMTMESIQSFMFPDDIPLFDLENYTIGGY